MALLEAFLKKTTKCKKHNINLESIAVTITIKGDKNKVKYGTNIEYCRKCYPDKNTKTFDEYMKQIAVGYMGFWNIEADPIDLNIEIYDGIL
ncbi:hypothetical protein GF361_01340 [Candidatus Woesearchaeota archaeon]|nr:hypothetical protein [Candidatus Woesearchaeota archaeon]